MSENLVNDLTLEEMSIESGIERLREERLRLDAGGICLEELLNTLALVIAELSSYIDPEAPSEKCTSRAAETLH